MNRRRRALLVVPLLLLAVLLLGCTRGTSTSAPGSATGTVGATGAPASSTAPSGTPAPSTTPAATAAPVYVEVATGTTSTTAPSVEFPKRSPLVAQRTVDDAQLPSGAFRGVTDPTGRYLAYVVASPATGTHQGVVRDTSTGKEWLVEERIAICQCDASSVNPGPIWSSSGRFVAFGTGNWREASERHVVVVEPGADRITELPRAAWMRSDFGTTSPWRPGYDTLVVGQTDGVFIYDAAARTSTHMSVGTWPRFVTRDLVQVDLLGADGRPDRTAFTDIWRGDEVARLPFVQWIPAPAIHYEDGRLALASQTPGPTCIGVTVAHPALTSPSICIPGANAPAWSPDGRVLAYSRADSPSSRSVILFDLAAGTQRPAAELLPASDTSQQYLTTWSADGTHLRLDRGHIGFGG